MQCLVPAPDRSIEVTRRCPMSLATVGQEGTLVNVTVICSSSAGLGRATPKGTLRLSNLIVAIIMSHG